MRVGVLSDAHGNIGGFRRAVRALSRCGATQFVFLGDAVGYIPDAEVVRELMRMGSAVRCIRGNHEHMLLTQVPSDRDDVYQLRRTGSNLSSQEVEFLDSWPDRLVINGASGPVLFVHGSPDQPTSGYVFPDSDLAAFNCSERWVFMGHTHRAFVRRLGNCTFVNAGSCGLPRDVGHLGAAAVLDLTCDEVELLRFDVRQDLEQAFAHFAPVHADVRELLDRQGKWEGVHVAND